MVKVARSPLVIAGTRILLVDEADRAVYPGKKVGSEQGDRGTLVEAVPPCDHPECRGFVSVTIMATRFEEMPEAWMVRWQDMDVIIGSYDLDEKEKAKIESMIRRAIPVERPTQADCRNRQNH